MSVAGRAASVARAALLFAVVLAPLVALGFLLASWPRVRIGTWFLFIPLTVIWLASIDLRWGISARLARLPRRALLRAQRGESARTTSDDVGRSTEAERPSARTQ